MRPASPKAQQKWVERRVLDSVACVRRTPLDRDDARDPDDFPDGFFVEADGTRSPAEVVAAFEREDDEDPRTGSRWRRAWLEADRMGREIEDAQGVPAAWGAHGAEPFAIPLDGTALIPPRAEPLRLGQWVAVALQQKLDRYGPTPDVILVVQLYSPFDLGGPELRWLGRWLEDRGQPFREVWIVNEYGTPPQKVPK